MLAPKKITTALHSKGSLILTGAILGLGFLSSAEAKISIPDEEFSALKAFAEATNIRGWKYNNWVFLPPFLPRLQPDPCDSFYGIQCEYGHIVSISLPDNNLVGTLDPYFLMSFPSLRHINLSNNQLSGNLLQIRFTNQLETFNLANNRFIGSIPNAGNLPNLRTYNVSNNNLDGFIGYIGGLPKLREFYAQNNSLWGSTPDVTGLTMLEVLDISHNQTSLLSTGLNTASKLRTLNFSFNNIYGSLPSLTGLTNLARADLSYNQFTGGFPDLTGLNLGELDLSHNRLTGALPSHIPDSLYSFRIGYNQFSGTLPVAPPSLRAGGSNLCFNNLAKTMDSAWDQATGILPWWRECYSSPAAGL